MEQLGEPTGYIEVHAFSTLTLTTTQLLSGIKDGIPETISGVLSRPFESNPPFPTVMLLHGSGGIEGNAIRWAHHLNRLGVATFVIDSYTGRGIPVRQPYDYVDGRGMMVDAYQGLAYLAQHPWLTDKSQPHYFSSRFLVLKAETGLATHGILLFRCHRGFGVRFTA